MMELREFDLKPFNADKRVSSLDQFLAYMNEEDFFDSFTGIGKRNCIRYCSCCVIPTQQRYFT